MKKNTALNSSKKFEPTLTDKVTSMLASQIRGGVYPVNARLPTEQFMTEEYGVSRTVIREAISRLKSEGLVETRQGSGTIVLAPSNYDSFKLPADTADHAQGVIHILELRKGIETEMAALAALNHTHEQLSKIRQALFDMDTATNDGRDGVNEDLAFHTAIAKASNNPHFPELLRMLTRSLEDAIRVTRGNEAKFSSMAEQVRREHQAILNAIETRNPDEARKAAFRHMSNTVGRINTAEESFWSGPDGKIARRLATANLQKNSL